MDYVSVAVEPGRGAARLGQLEGVEDSFELLRGISRADGFPDDASFTMNANFPDRLLLEDVVTNQEGLLVVSERLRDFLADRASHANEFLPVTIINHKGRREKERYFIAHQVGLQDCIDRERSEYELNPIDPQYFFSLERLVLDETRVDPEVALFRMAAYPYVPIARRDLADAVVAEGFTGIAFNELDAWSDD